MSPKERMRKIELIKKIKEFDRGIAVNMQQRAISEKLDRFEQIKESKYNITGRL